MVVGPLSGLDTVQKSPPCVRVKMGSPEDVVARWNVPLKGKVHAVEFEHGPLLTGKRVVVVDGKVIVRKDFMFNLIGTESFRIGSTKCHVAIENSTSVWEFKYTLHVDGKPLESFLRESKKRTRTWLPYISGKMRRIVLETTDLTIYVDGKQVDTTGEFLEEDDDDESQSGPVTGSMQHFTIDGKVDCKIKIYSSGSRLHGILYDLYIHDILQPTPPDQQKALAMQRDDRAEGAAH